MPGAPMEKKSLCSPGRCWILSGAKGDEDLTAAQNALLTARARYRLRNDAIEAVMVTDPILKAVHSGTQASPIERHVLSS